MDIWDSNKLLVFIAFVIPGFISLKTYQLISPSQTKDSDKLLIDAIAYSSVNYALLLWPIYEIESNKIQESAPSLYVLFYVFVLFVAPVSWACLFNWLRTTDFFQNSMPHPTEKPWDFVFGRRKPYWLIVTLKNGQRIAGRYDSSSFASSAPAAEQIYLEESWVLNDDGGFERQRNATAGILVLSTEIVTVEFFKLHYEEKTNGR